MKLLAQAVEKEWGVDSLPAAFSGPCNTRIGEIVHDGQAAPLLVKHIFTSAPLSIQVHPDDAAARARGLPHGKWEAWLIVDAAPDACIAIGPRHDSNAAALTAAARAGTLMDWVDWRPVRAGDFLLVPPGTVHAIGAGISLVEVQQAVDVTWRMYDHGRDRPLHLDDALSVALPSRWPETLLSRAEGDCWLCTGPAFAVRHLVGPAQHMLPAGAIVVPLAGPVSIGGVTADFGEVHAAEIATDVVLPAGATMLVVTGPLA